MTDFDRLNIAIEVACEEEGVTRNQFFAKSRLPRYVDARRLYYYLAFHVLGLSHQQATNHAGAKNHSTGVLHCQNVQNWMAQSEAYRQKIEDASQVLAAIIKKRRPTFSGDRPDMVRRLKTYCYAQTQLYKLHEFDLFAFLAKSILHLQDSDIAATYERYTREANESLAKVLDLLFCDSKISSYLAHHNKQATAYINANQ